MMKFTVEEEMGIFMARFFVETNLGIFEEYLQYLTKYDLSGNIKIFHDHRQSIAVLKPAEIESLVNLFRQYLSEANEIKIAYVSDAPKGIALAMLFKDQMMAANFQIEFFSEEESALIWLNLLSPNLMI